VDRNDPNGADDPTLPPSDRPLGWEPVVGTTYEPLDERTIVPKRDVDGEHRDDKDMAGDDTDTTGDRPR
jgi:hypothetical protein